MIRIALLADLHFGAHRPELLDPLRRDIADQHVQAVVVAGDLTQRAAPDEFAAASAFLASLPAPVLAVPGNHDIPGSGAPVERMRDPRGRWRSLIQPETEPMLALPGATILGLDTVRRMQPHLDWSAGGVSAARRARFAARLGATTAPLRVVVAHHPLRHPHWARARATPLGAEPALATMAEAGVACVLSGHLHRDAVLDGTPVVVIAGSALSHRTRGRANSWSVVEVGQAGVGVRRRVMLDGGWTAGAAWAAVGPPPSPGCAPGAGASSR